MTGDINVCFIRCIYISVVRRIAKNDNNKRILVELGVLHQLVSMAGNEDVDEQRGENVTIETKQNKRE